jgi:hypothetical protein
MIQQLVARMVANTTPPLFNQSQAAQAVLGSDPFDLVLHMEQVWDTFGPWSPNPAPAGPARRNLWSAGFFNRFPPPAGVAAWDHLGYALVLEMSRAVQIFRRVVREYRSGEGLGMPSVETQRWLDATETILFGASYPAAAWLSTSHVRPDPEAVRRNAYFRIFGMDLSFGSDDNRPFVFDKATTANTSFVPVFEELLFELWQAISNIRNQAGVNQADDDRIYRLAEQLNYMLRARRQLQVLGREELAAATALGWVELTLSTNTPVVIDLRAQATSPADRLRIIGERVGLAPHSRSAALFSMASDLSLVLRTIEAGYVSGPQFSWLLYSTTVPAGTPPLPPGATPRGSQSRRVITEWAAASGKDLKTRARPVEVASRQLVRTR